MDGPELRFNPLSTLLPVLAAVLTSAIALAQPPPGSPSSTPWELELWLSAGISSGIRTGDLASSYIPAVENISSTGVAGQTLFLETDDGFAVSVGVDLWLTPRFGLQIFADRTDFDLAGTSTSYDVKLEYEARQPPDYELRPYTWEQSTPWADPTGTIDATTIALNVLYRRPFSERVSATLSGGITSSTFSGELDSLGFTLFRLGGHSVLFPEEYEIGTTLEDDPVTGFDAGAAVEFAISKRLALVAGARYHGGSSAELPVRVRAILNLDEVIMSIPLEEIEARLAPGAIRIEQDRTVVFVAVKLVIR